MNKFKKIAKHIFNALIIVVLVVIIVMVTFNISINIQKNQNNKTPNILGYATFSVEDDLASPDVNAGDLILIYVTLDLHEGDFITFLQNNNVDYQTQKISQIVYDDNHQYVKQYIVSAGGTQSVVIPTRVYGKVVANFRGFAPVVKFFNSIAGTSLLIALALVVIFLPDIASLFRRDKKKKSTASVQDNAEIASGDAGQNANSATVAEEDKKA